ncbi:Fungalysin/Thermolysin Extracellular metalloproteinase 5, partial [Tulasnella sp. 408]
FYRGPAPSLKDASSTFAGDEQGGIHDLAYYCRQLATSRSKTWEAENPELAAQLEREAAAFAKAMEDPEKWKELLRNDEEEVQYAPEGQVTFGRSESKPAQAEVNEAVFDIPHWAWSAGLKNANSDRLDRLYDMVCGNSDLLDAQFYLNDGENLRELGPIAEAVDAALFFILAVHPDQDKAAEIMQNIPKFRQQVTSTFTHHLHGNGSPEVELEGVPATVSPVKATLAYVQTPCEAETEEGTHNGCRAKDQTSVLTLVWKLVVEMQDNWYEAHVDARLPTRVMNVVDWVSDYAPHGEEHTASKDCWPGKGADGFAPIPKDPARDSVHKVWGWGVNDPQEGSRDFVKNPHDQTASPLGWHAIPAANNPTSDYGYPLQGLKNDAADDLCYFTTTWGNNVQAQENWEGRNKWYKNYRPEGNHNLTFVYPYGAGKKHDGDKVDPKSYIDLSVAQMFYTSNMVHDLYYRYGFNEVAGNFQNYNFGKGGKENDGVTANAQDGSGYNNANFATPPDGQRGRMRMYVWDTATPFRDGDLEAGIGILEKHPYGDTLFPPQPNAQGVYNYPNDFYLPPLKGKTAPIPKHGNALMVQLVLDAMKLQPCRPSFFAARDAIIQADENLTGGENACTLWAGFASRGLGPFAKIKGGTPWGGGVRTNDYSVPVKCGGTGKPDRGDGGNDGDDE